jgi:hypothetical protein
MQRNRYTYSGNLTELNCFGYLIGSFYIGPCAEEQVNYICPPQSGGVDKKSIIIFLVRAKQK